MKTILKVIEGENMLFHKWVVFKINETMPAVNSRMSD